MNFFKLTKKKIKPRLNKKKIIFCYSKKKQSKTKFYSRKKKIIQRHKYEILTSTFRYLIPYYQLT